MGELDGLSPFLQEHMGRRAGNAIFGSHLTHASSALHLFPSPGFPTGTRRASWRVKLRRRRNSRSRHLWAWCCSRLLAQRPQPLSRLAKRTSSRPTPPTPVPPGESNIVTDGCSLIALWVRLDIRDKYRFRCSGARPLRDSTRSPGFLPALSQNCFRPVPSPSPPWVVRSHPIPPAPSEPDQGCKQAKSLFYRDLSEVSSPSLGKAHGGWEGPRMS
jgi:hypothetical protein